MITTYEISPAQGDDADGVAATVRRWFAGWSPGDAPWDGEAFRDVFKAGAGAIDVLDDMGGAIVRLDSVDAYVETWTPFMAPFSHWSIAPIGPIKVQAGDDLALVTFSFEADGRDADGNALRPKPGQHATLVLERTADGWRVIREHLSTFQQPATA